MAVVHVLPFTTAAHTEMLALRSSTLFGQGVECDGFSLKISLTFLEGLDIHHITRDGIVQKYHLTPRCCGNGHAVCTCIQNHNVFKDVLSRFSSQVAKIVALCERHG